MVIALPIMKHSQGLQLRLAEDILSLRVPSIYKLELGLPITIDIQETKSYFDCKLRKLIVIMRPRS